MIAGLEKRIQQARESKELVVNLSYFGDGFTLPEVIELIKTSNQSFFLGKEKEDGSNSIHCFCKRKKIHPEKIELCGAFLDVCILETWKGLKLLEYNVLPVNTDLAIATGNNWRNIKRYPDGYLGGKDGILNRRGQRKTTKESS